MDQEKEKRFELRLPGYGFSKIIDSDSLETEEGRDNLKMMFKKNIEREFKNWMENEFEKFFDSEFNRNLESWKKEEYGFAEKLIHKIP